MIKFRFNETTTIVIEHIKFRVNVELFIGDTCGLVVYIDDGSVYVFSKRYDYVDINIAFGAMSNGLHDIDEWHDSEYRKNTYVSLIKIIDDYLDLLKLFVLEVL